jgi:small subunit ribosomal protein S6
MQGYELLYLIPSHYNNEQLRGIINKVGELLVKHKAQISHNDIWANRKLAYPIQRIEHSFYVLCYFQAEPSMLFSIKQELNMSQDILRSIVLEKKDLEKEINRFVKHTTKEARQGEITKEQPERTEKTEEEESNEAPKKEDDKKDAEQLHKPKKAPKVPKMNLDKKLEELLGDEIEL